MKSCSICGNEHCAKGLCVEHYRQLDYVKKHHNESQKRFIERNKDYYKKYYLEHPDKYREKIDALIEYRKKFIGSRSLSTGIFLPCPVCGKTGQIRIHSKLNRKTGKRYHFTEVHIQHYSEGVFGKTCYVSVYKFPEFKTFLGETYN